MVLYQERSETRDIHWECLSQEDKARRNMDWQNGLLGRGIDYDHSNHEYPTVRSIDERASRATSIDHLPTLIEVKATQDRGMALFATEDIKPGVELISEAALLTVTSNDIDDIDNLENETVQQLRPQINNLDFVTRSDWLQCSKPVASMTDPDFQRFRNNCFKCPTENGKAYCWAFFLKIARANHDCSPNAMIDITMVNGRWHGGLRTVREIKKGEEVTIDYISADFDSIDFTTANQRKKILQDVWNFQCTCAACQNANTSDANRLNIRRLYNHLYIAVGTDTSDDDGDRMDIDDPAGSVTGNTANVDDNGAVSTVAPQTLDSWLPVISELVDCCFGEGIRDNRLATVYVLAYMLADKYSEPVAAAYYRLENARIQEICGDTQSALQVVEDLKWIMAREDVTGVRTAPTDGMTLPWSLADTSRSILREIPWPGSPGAKPTLPDRKSKEAADQYINLHVNPENYPGALAGPQANRKPTQERRQRRDATRKRDLAHPSKEDKAEEEGDDDDGDDDTQWKVDAVTNSMIENDCLMYKVKYTGYGSASWQPWTNTLGCLEQVRDFHTEWPLRPGPHATIDF